MISRSAKESGPGSGQSEVRENQLTPFSQVKLKLDTPARLSPSDLLWVFSPMRKIPRSHVVEGGIGMKS